MINEPDEALLWARNKCLDYAPSQYKESILSGGFDHTWDIPALAEGYRAGYAAASRHIEELEASRIRALNILRS